MENEIEMENETVKKETVELAPVEMLTTVETETEAVILVETETEAATPVETETAVANSKLPN